MSSPVLIRMSVLSVCVTACILWCALSTPPTLWCSARLIGSRMVERGCRIKLPFSIVSRRLIRIQRCSSFAHKRNRKEIKYTKLCVPECNDHSKHEQTKHTSFHKPREITHVIRLQVTHDRQLSYGDSTSPSFVVVAGVDVELFTPHVFSSGDASCVWIAGRVTEDLASSYVFVSFFFPPSFYCKLLSSRTSSITKNTEY